MTVSEPSDDGCKARISRLSHLSIGSYPAAALGSWWGLFVYVLFMPALLWRIFDEEKFLAKNLPGYSEYLNKVPYRLVPYLW